MLKKSKKIQKKILGIDEAGRGCVIGPLVMAGVEIEEKDSEWLLTQGIKDSKQLSPKKRQALATIIQEVADDIYIVEIPASVVDQYCFQGRLNSLEAEKAVEIISHLPCDVVYIDAPERGGKRFGDYILSLLGKTKIQIVSENHADVNYPVVSASSIIAKVTRDRIISELQEKVGDFGSGYPSDPKTRRFLSQVVKPQHIPPYIRKSWQTIQDLLECGNSSLF